MWLPVRGGVYSGGCVASFSHLSVSPATVYIEGAMRATQTKPYNEPRTDAYTMAKSPQHELQNVHKMTSFQVGLFNRLPGAHFVVFCHVSGTQPMCSLKAMKCNFCLII